MPLTSLAPVAQPVDDPTGPTFNDFQDQYDQAQGFHTMTLVLILVLGAISLVYAVFWIWTLIDAATRPDAAWAEVGQNKILWIVVMVVFSITSLVYVFWPRPLLKAAVAGSPPHRHLTSTGG